MDQDQLRALARKFLCQVGYSPRTVDAALKDRAIDPVSFVAVCQKLASKAKERPNFDGLPLSTWHGTIVRVAFSTSDDDFPPDETWFNHEDAKRIAESATYVCHAEIAHLFARLEDGDYRLFQLIYQVDDEAPEPPQDLGLFSKWLAENPIITSA